MNKVREKKSTGNPKMVGDEAERADSIRRKGYWFPEFVLPEEAKAGCREERDAAVKLLIEKYEREYESLPPSVRGLIDEQVRGWRGQLRMAKGRIALLENRLKNNAGNAR